ncbi:hypothetical protein OH76DRAFT_1394753 [Lentinus brumalis]|uniref:Ubiquitin-like domain-containing protein n=1 Tax=Lentinus brumalis TaxID=2498619 RepID=A0A371DWT3_9APHY|nr:hypothetical protein OH76DRAFT_1394753 [Polyporus brumalis]
MSATIPNTVSVKWKSRMPAAFDSTTVADIVQKACLHFHLRLADNDYVLIGVVQDTELEITDDTLKHIMPSHTTVTLSRVPRACNADEDTRSSSQPASRVCVPNLHPLAGPSTVAAGTGTRRLSSSALGISTLQVSTGVISPIRVHSGALDDASRRRNSESCGKTQARATVTPPDQEFTVFVKTYAGKMYVLYLEAQDTVSVLRYRVYFECGILPEYQILAYARKQLDDDSLTLVNYGIRHESVVHCVFRDRYTPPPEGKIAIYTKTLTGKTMTVHIEAGATIDVLRDRIYRQDGRQCTEGNRLILGGKVLEDGRTLGDYRISHETTLHLVQRNCGKKPVIYLFPPEHLPNATVSVRLVPQWSFSHTYPLEQIEVLESGKESVTWSVSADVDGTLVEKTTGVELSYLFWEALSNGDATPPSPPLSPGREVRVEVEHFDPSCPSLEPHSPITVLLPFAELLPYIDGVLKSLSLHTSARNDFITYWLPALSKTPYVALRFVPQAAYERAAELEVTPTPDVVTRVFMLFRGVSAEDTKSATWVAARDRAGHVDWPSIVGVKVEAWDKSRFRVLEWGAMEVL